MGLISFLKGAGEKVFGWDTEEEVKGPSPEQIAAEKQARNEKASAALKTLVDKHDLIVADLKVGFNAGTVSLDGRAEKAATAEKAALVVGNVTGVSSVNNNISVVFPEPEATFHTVVSGDTLSKISKTVYGDPMKYNEIFEANKPMLKSVDLIYPGQVLRCPALS